MINATTTSTNNVLDNSTMLQTNDTFEKFFEFDWIFPVSVNFVLMIITLWMLISLIHYGFKTRKWSQAGHSDKLNAGLIYTSVIVCAGTCMIRYAISLVYMNIGFGVESNDLCDTVADTAVCLYALVLFSVYLFLWFRQRVFYKTYVVKSSFSNLFSLFSSGSIGVIFVAGICAALLNILPDNHRSSVSGCIYTPDEAQRIGYWISVAVAVFLGQVVLLGLFVYPLRKIFSLCSPISIFSHPKEQGKQKIRRSRKIGQYQAPIRPNIITVTGDSSNDNQASHFVIKLSPSFRRATAMRVSQILRRTLVFAILSLSSDIFLLVFSNYIVKAEGNRRIPSMIYDVNSFLNLLLVVLSFVQYKKMLTSFCCNQETNSLLSRR